MTKSLLLLILVVVVTCQNLFTVVSVGNIDGPGDGMYTQTRIPADGTELPIISYFDVGENKLLSSLFVYI